jgi:hypothetical protein
MPRRILVALAATFALAAVALVPTAASAYAPADEATVHPGVMTYTEGGQCTSNFIFADGSGTYIGQAAHCAGTGTATETDGCDSGSLPLGTPVDINGASQPGTLVYSSWLAMQAAGETDPDACAFNDLGLVKIDPADVDKVNPSVPGFGGPTGLGSESATADTVFSYGNSSLRAGITLLSPKQGNVLNTAGNGWSRNVYTVTPGIPGDSGSGFLNDTGGAIGTLSTVQIAPIAGSNGVSDLPRELAYAQSHGFAGLSLVKGTEPFTPDLAGALLSGGIGG